MSAEAPSAVSVSIDVGVGGVLLANMLEGWLAHDPSAAPGEAADESEDLRRPPPQTRLHLFAPVDPGPSAPPSGEHRAPVCVAREGARPGLERRRDSDPRPGPGQNRNSDDGVGGLQDSRGGRLDGSWSTSSWTRSGRNRN